MQMTAAKMDQRIGRIIRQGNLHSPKNWNTEVSVTLYGQERSMDAPIYNMLATKGKMTLQALKGQFLGDEFEDPASELTVAMASLVAQATGDTRALDVAKLTEDVRKLTMEENAFYRQVSDVKRERDTAESAKVSAETLATDMEELSKAAAEATKGKDSLVMTGAKKSYTGEDIQPTLDKIATNMEASLSKKDDRINLVLRFGDNLYAGITGRATDEWYQDGDGKRGVRLGRSYSVEFTVADAPPSMGNFGIETKKRILSSELSSPKNLLRAVNAVAGRAETRAKEATTTAAKATKDQTAWQKKLDATTFAKAGELKAKRAELSDLQQDLMGKKKPVPELDYGTGGEMPRDSSFMDWLDAKIKATDYDPTKTLEGITGAPVWMTRGALNAALRAVRAAVKAGKSITEAIRAGVAAIKAKNLKGFDEAEAEKFLETEARKTSSEESGGSWSDVQQRIADAQTELMAAIKQHMTPPKGMTKAAALKAKNAAHRKLLAAIGDQLKQMTNLSSVETRSPAETAEMISQTVDLLNSIQDEITERKSQGKDIGNDLSKLRVDLQARLMMLKGWADDQTDAAAQNVKPQRTPAETAETRARFMELESATDLTRSTAGEFWQKIKLGLRYLTSPIPELPLTGERAEKSALFRRGYRLFAVENNAVRLEAAKKIEAVVEPLTKLGRKPADNAVLKRYYALGEAIQRAKMDEGKKKRLQEIQFKLESQLNKDPFNLFRRLVLYRDLWWRGTFLKNDQGEPITLPMGLTVDEVAGELRKLTGAITEHPDGLAITEALRRHYALTEELQKSILAHGEIIPESLRNPLYFPHHIVDSWTGRVDRVRPTTEEDFRRYLIAPMGSGKLIQTDYMKAMYLHTADVLAHNGRVDLVDKYWKPYDISEQLKKQHGNAWNKPWNVPAGYKLFTPFKKLPLRMDYILSREVLAEKLGVLFNDGDLRTQMSGKVLNVKPEDLHAAMVAGEKIQWALPDEIADALNGIAKRESAATNPGLGHAIGLPFRLANNFWKKTKLFAPWNWIRYEYGNLSTDAVDKVLAADPVTAKYLSRAARELWNADTAEQSPEFKAAQREGVFDTITAGEAGELTKLPQFKAFLTPGELKMENIRHALSAPMRGSKFREGTFRYAKFLADVERLRGGKEAVYAGAFHGDIQALGEDVDGLRPILEGDELIYAKAAEISLKTYGDYNSLGVVGQWLRTYAVPFWSWQDVNFRYHANQLRNIADGIKGIKGASSRQAALRYAGVRVVTTLIAVGIAKELWNQFGGVALGLWDDDDDLEASLSEADRRRGHILVGKDAKGQAMVVYTPSALSDVAEWMGGVNMKRLFMEYVRGQITLDQFISDYAKQLPKDVVNKAAQSAGPLIKAPYELASNKATFPDILDQRTIPKSERGWRFVGTLTDDRAVNVLRTAFDGDYMSQPAAEQLQQIILQVRRRDPEQWAYFEVKEDAADWKEAKTGDRNDGGDHNSKASQAVRNFRKSIYHGDVANAERFYNRLIELGYTAERLDASIRNQDPLSALSIDLRKEYTASLTERQKQELALANRYYAKIKAMDRREKQLFPKKGQQPRPNPELLKRIVEEQGQR